MAVFPRRDFLKSLALTAVALSLDPYSGISVASNVYSNARLGLSVVKPPGWEFESIADFVAVRDRQILQETLGDELHPLKDPENLPVFVIGDPEHRNGEWGPGIILFDEPVVRRPRSDAVAHSIMLTAFRAAHRNFELLGDPVTVALNGAAGTQSEWQYLHELDDGAAHSLKVRSLLVFRGERAHTFHLVDYADAACVPKATFDAFINSIRYHFSGN